MLVLIVLVVVLFVVGGFLQARRARSRSIHFFVEDEDDE